MTSSWIYKYPPPASEQKAPSLREAAKQAMEALGSSLYPQPRQMAAIAALRAALAEPAQEPVAWMTHGNDLLPLFHRTRAGALAWGAEPQPLYTAPPQRKPLTDYEIADVYLEWDAAPSRSMADFARAIEKAHGIVPSDCTDSHQTGCDRCRSPLWAGTKCDVCGRKA